MRVQREKCGESSRSAYLSDQDNLGNKEYGDELRWLAKHIGITAEKHDRDESLSRAGLQEHYCVLLDCFF